jgi:hypothetical protein
MKEEKRAAKEERRAGRGKQGPGGEGRQEVPDSGKGYAEMGMEEWRAAKQQLSREELRAAQQERKAGRGKGKKNKRPNDRFKAEMIAAALIEPKVGLHESVCVREEGVGIHAYKTSHDTHMTHNAHDDA